MRPLRSVGIYFAFVFLGGALLAPWIYWLVHSGPTWIPSLHKLDRYPFHTFVTRSFQIIALIGLWPFLRSLQIQKWREVGFCSPQTERRKLATGLMLGFGSLALVGIISIIAGARSLDVNHSAARVLAFIGQTTLIALGVAILEELLYRGVLFGALRKVHGSVFALIFSSAFFALVHFFERKPLVPQTIQWFSGFVTLGQMLRGFVQFDQLVPGFFTLFLVGALLAMAYQRTGNLYFSIGLHAGWIFWIKSCTFLTRTSSSTNSWFWGTAKLINGWLGFLIILATLGILLLWPGLFGRKQDSA